MHAQNPVLISWSKSKNVLNHYIEIDLYIVILYSFVIIRYTWILKPFDISLVDTIPPVIQNCIGDISETTPLGSGGRIMTWTSPTATDNSGVVTLASRSHRSGQFLPTGTTTVIYRFVDGSGNEAICSFDIIISEGKPRSETKSVLIGVRYLVSSSFWISSHNLSTQTYLKVLFYLSLNSRHNPTSNPKLPWWLDRDNTSRIRR